MKHVFTSHKWLKVCFSILLVLNLSSLLSRSTVIASEQFDPWPAEMLYQQALSWEMNENDMIHAAIFMFAYVQRNPSEYVNNYHGRKDFVVQKLDEYLFATNKAILLLKQNQLGPYACPIPGSQGGVCSVHVAPSEILPEVFPPDAVLVCTEPGYQGRCKILFIGNYNNYQRLGVPDNSVASVKVGSRVKITLYASAFGRPPMITLAKNDSDLSNNTTGDKFSWDKRVSAAKIEWKQP